MKVLQINSVCGTGSTGRIATDIHNMLVKLGHESYIAYGREVPKNCGTSIRIGRNYDNYTHALLTRIFDKHGFGSVKATQEFIRAVESINPDIVHLHNIHGYYINIEILFDYLKKTNKPVIWTLHDCWTFTGHCAYFDYVDCSKWIDGCYACPEKTSYPSSLFIDNSKSNFSKKNAVFTGVRNLILVTPSNWLAGLIKLSYLNEYPVEKISNGIDLEVFKPTLSSFRSRYHLEGKFIILGVANMWNRRKGLEYFIQLSARVTKDEAIVLVGLSDKQKNVLPKEIIGITRTNSVNELAEIYSAADVYVNPTLEDNFPTTNLEALACGTPVITFNTGGSVENIDDTCGFIVEKGNIDELVYRINDIKARGKTGFSEASVKRANKLYNKEDRYKEYVDLYIKNSR